MTPSSFSFWLPSLLLCLSGLRTEGLLSVSGGPHVSLLRLVNPGLGPRPEKSEWIWWKLFEGWFIEVGVALTTYAWRDEPNVTCGLWVSPVVSTCFTAVSSKACEPWTLTTSWKEWMNLVKTIWGLVYWSWCSTDDLYMERWAKCYLWLVGVPSGVHLFHCCLLHGLCFLDFNLLLKRVNEFGENILRVGLLKLV